MLKGSLFELLGTFALIFLVHAQDQSGLKITIFKITTSALVCYAWC